jgi:N-carbamoyl-L-amino-acid hydrolase
MNTDKFGTIDYPISSERLNSDIASLADLVNGSEHGWTRQVFSDEYRASREFVRDRMRKAGLDVHTDSAGNIIGILKGKMRGAPALMTGSHTDTVRQGGRFDGVVGLMGAIEVARAVREAGIAPNRDLIIVDFLGEETNDFGLGCLGSRSLVGGLGIDDLARQDSEAHTLGDAYREFGLDPGTAIAERWPKERGIYRYVELHVEQGPLLESRGVEVGVVTAIAGIERLLAHFSGRADHAGTMPMSDRRDALVAAAESVLAVRREACGAPIHGVGTASAINTIPGSPNVVPSEATLAAELRSVDPDWLSPAKKRLGEEIATVAHQYGVNVELDWRNDNAYTPTAGVVRDAIADAVDGLGLEWEAVPSGATHDAAHIAKVCPMGMIFIPSHKGRSHCPEEFTSLKHITDGVRVLGSALQILDGQDVE